jgi:hypothetical protein
MEFGICIPWTCSRRCGLPTLSPSMVKELRWTGRAFAGRAGRGGGPRLGEGRLPHERRLLREERLCGVGGGSGGGRVSCLLHRSEPAATSGARPRGTHPIPTLNPLRTGTRSARPDASASDISGLVGP